MKLTKFDALVLVKVLAHVDIDELPKHIRDAAFDLSDEVDDILTAEDSCEASDHDEDKKSRSDTCEYDCEGCDLCCPEENEDEDEEAEDDDADEEDPDCEDDEEDDEDEGEGEESSDEADDEDEEGEGDDEEVDGSVDAACLHDLIPVKSSVGSLEFEATVGADEDECTFLIDGYSEFTVDLVRRQGKSLEVHSENTGEWKSYSIAKFPKGWATLLPLGETLEVL